MKQCITRSGADCTLAEATELVDVVPRVDRDELGGFARSEWAHQRVWDEAHLGEDWGDGGQLLCPRIGESVPAVTELSEIRGAGGGDVPVGGGRDLQPLVRSHRGAERVHRTGAAGPEVAPVLAGRQLAAEELEHAGFRFEEVLQHVGGAPRLGGGAPVAGVRGERVDGGGDRGVGVAQVVEGERHGAGGS